ncbi:MAG: aminopeptidase P N-terminal domain-containing protein [Bacteroidota bacterium]
MKYKPIPTEFFVRNREKLISRMKNNAMAVFVSSDEMPRNGDQNFPFRQNSDFFYLTGIDQEESILCISPNHPNEKMREILFVKKTNEHIAVWYGHKYTKEEATITSGIQNVMWLDEFNATLPDLMFLSKSIYLNLQENGRYSTDVIRNERRFSEKLMHDYPLQKYRRAAPLLTEFRLIKEEEELDVLKKACDITAKAFFKAAKVVKPSAMEYEVEAELISEMLRNGASGHSFAPIVAGGKSACVLHYIENNKPLLDGDLVLMDFGAEYANYAGDCTRTIPVNGVFSPRQREVYEACLYVFKEAKKLLVPENTIANAQNEVAKMMEKQLIALGLFTQKQVDEQNPDAPLYKKYYMHGVSHFIGLDVHDVGSREEKFKEGMVLSCEPGIYIPEEGIGIRIETDILVADIPIDLMAQIPVEVDEIEKLMKK